MNTIDAINKRVSVRKYAQKPVERDLLTQLVDAARRAPTARKIEPWEFIVVTDREILARLGEIADHGPFIAESGACIAVYCDDTKYYLEDGSAATENILLAATDAGLGTCWVAGDKKPYAGEVSNILSVPAKYKLVSLISVGWAEVMPEQSRNRGVEDVIHWDRFNK